MRLSGCCKVLMCRTEMISPHSDVFSVEVDGFVCDVVVNVVYAVVNAVCDVVVYAEV